MTHRGDCGDEQFRAQLGLYALGAMGPDEYGFIEIHLARCGPCLASTEELGQAVDYLGALSPDDVTAILGEP